jgi:hypothetical protein
LHCQYDPAGARSRAVARRVARDPGGGGGPWELNPNLAPGGGDATRALISRREWGDIERVTLSPPFGADPAGNPVRLVGLGIICVLACGNFSF